MRQHLGVRNGQSLKFMGNSGKAIKSRRMIREASAKREVFTFNGSTAERGETSQKPYLRVCPQGCTHLA